MRFDDEGAMKVIMSAGTDKAIKSGIVVIAYDRDDSLLRLLDKLSKCKYENDSILLIISIDFSDNREVARIADSFEWEYGEKKVVKQKERLGLRNHIIKCGNYMNEYDLDALIVFEDDILPSSIYFSYALKATEKYINNMDILGVSLYAYEIMPGSFKKFSPIQNGFDNYFMQFAMSWGQVWFKKQWNKFYAWYKENTEWVNNDLVPEYVSGWNENSWLKYHIRYCIEKNKYFAYPYISFTTNFAEKGEHIDRRTDIYQSTLIEEMNREYSFSDFSDEAVKYDAFFECQYLAKIIGIAESELEVDLNNEKKGTDKRYLITNHKYDYPIIKSWSNQLRPLENNIIVNLQGEGVFLYDLGNVNGEYLSLEVVAPEKEKYESYYGLLLKWIKCIYGQISIMDYFSNRNWNKIAIYGYGDLGKLLRKGLEISGIDVSCLLDRMPSDAGIITLDEFSQRKICDDIDVIIVTPFLEYKSIETEIKCVADIEIVPLDYVIDQLNLMRQVAYE